MRIQLYDKAILDCCADSSLLGNVPVSPALSTPTNDPATVLKFAQSIGYPIIVKAVDGGGGRGIRIIRDEASLANAVKRAVEESPSKQVFAEKAAIDGFRHVEVQIIGDGKGDVTHLWERECSIQRRYQKIVEVAPSTVVDRGLVAKVIGDAMRMAKHVSILRYNLDQSANYFTQINYFSLGTFEFLVNPSTKEYYFLEINPRLQVEHTITESISTTDIVRTQLLLSQGSSLDTCGLPSISSDPASPPPAHSIQLRITSEDVTKDWSLSIGKITSFQFPSGNGIRMDTHLISGHATVVSSEFDSLVAKLIVTASSWEAAVLKARRALDDTTISGVKTNLDILRAIVASPDFLHGRCDTQWLEQRQAELLGMGQKISDSRTSTTLGSSTDSSGGTALAAANTLFRKGDAWSITLAPRDDKQKNIASSGNTPPHHLEITRILRNEFPQSLSAELLFTSPPKSSGQQPETTPYTMTLSSTSSSAAALTSHHRRGNPSDPTHIIIPFPGTLVEVLVDEGDTVREGDVICVVQQMKMELEVRANRSGRVNWVCEVEDGESVGEGVLVAVVEGVERGARL